MHKSIFIINGPATAGKDTFVSMISSIVPTVNYSSVQVVKEAAALLGWAGGKSEKDRKFLSDMKYLCSEYSDAPYKSMEKKIYEFLEDEIHEMLFLHIRERAEIERMVKEYPMIKTILVTRSGVAPIMSNSADAQVYDWNYDYVIENSGTLGDLKLAATDFVNDINNKEVM